MRSLVLGLSLAVLGLSAAQADYDPSAPTAASLSALQSAIPQPNTGVPLPATSAGTPGTTMKFNPSDGTQPSGSRSTQVMTTSAGTFTVTWAVPLTSSTPVANVIPINTAANAPIVCNLTASPTASTVVGKCWTGVVSSTLPTLASSLLGYVVSMFSTSAANIPIEVVAREPSQ